MKRLVQKEEIAYYETAPQQIILYLNDIPKPDKKSFHIAMTAIHSGDFASPLSMAYPYYDDTRISWFKGSSISIAPPSPQGGG